MLPVALPACIHLILELVIRAAGGPLASQAPGGVGVVVTKAHFLASLAGSLGKETNNDLTKGVSWCPKLATCTQTELT